MTDRTRMEQQQVGLWKGQLGELHARISPRFVRPEVRARAGRYLCGLLEPVEHRNGWQLAEATGERSPDGVQRLLNGARWDAGEVRDDLRAYVVEHLGDPEAVLIVDETGFLKKGDKSVGVQRQYSGTAGKVENCQIGVFLAYAAPRGRAFIDRALYLPEEEWAEDEERREEAGVPERVSFATKGGLARNMLERAFEAEVPASWVTAEEAVSEAPGEAWERVEVGEGSKGPRVYDWARVRLPYDECASGWAQWLLARRSVSDPEEIAYYRAYCPEDAPLSEMAKVAGARWSIEINQTHYPRKPPPNVRLHAA